MEFKRFSKDKQEQINQFVAYAQMMGLTGKDIRSIGDKLDRERKAVERKANMEIIKGFKCIAIGKDAMHKGEMLESMLDNRFKLKTDSGVYKFNERYGIWEIYNPVTQTGIKHRPSYDHEVGTSRFWSRACRWHLLLDIYFGKVSLNF